MDNNSSSPTLQYQNLGNKVFWLFVFENSPFAILLLLVTIVLFILSFQPFLTDTLWGNIKIYVLQATLISFVLFVIVTAISFASAWFLYISYMFLVSEDSLKIKRGVINKIEIAIPYRQIQNVDIERGFLFQILGLSRLIILTAGHEDAAPIQNDEAEGVIPAIDKKMAEWLQTELLKRAEVQKIIQTNNQAINLPN